MSHAAPVAELWSKASMRPKMKLVLLAMTSAFACLALAGCTGAALNDRPSGGSATGTTVTGTGGGGGGDWCQVQAVLSQNCLGCHASQPLFGAPMPLVTFENLHAHAVTNPSKLVYEMVAQRIHDDQHPMPPPSTNDRLTSAEAAIVD